MSMTPVYMKNPTNTPEATISASGFFSSFKFHVPPTPRNSPPYPVRYRIRMIKFRTCKFNSKFVSAFLKKETRKKARWPDKLGVNITDEQLKQLKENISNVDFEKAAEEEKKTRHDVMAHVHVFAEQCPLAAPIIHLGATSCDIVDNADLIIIRDALDILLPKIAQCINLLSHFAVQHKDIPTLGYTHLQPAQLTTVGKRACLWLQDFLLSEEAIADVREKLKFRGIKGTTGTQASFLQLLNGNFDKVKELDRLVSLEAGFQKSYPVTGQTYSRLVDCSIISALTIFGAAVHKISTDLRILANFNEVSEPIESTQIGSSAMPYKQNPMRCERACSISRYLMNLITNPLNTASVQWFERTLDDSANRRITIPEAFLAADSVVRLMLNVFQGLRIHPQVINQHVNNELPFMASENIVIAVVNHGGNRQECHEKIRVLSFEVKKEIVETGCRNNLIEKLEKDPYFANIVPELSTILDPKTFTGCASAQVTEFIENHVHPVLKKYESKLSSILPVALEI
ncbi:hypothetical protein V9T40_009206 [Parthenolecanium corni]|uniref:Adenylosuccinate lyase n=1 Tax=Parthenolecanium corni TaxID=536013 RepID=A0AAN9TS34_9HEMI